MQKALSSPVPTSDAYTIRFLVPKGTVVNVTPIRIAPRRQQMLTMGGTAVPVLYVEGEVIPTSSGGALALKYVLDTPTYYGGHLTIDAEHAPHYDAVSTPQGDPLFDSNVRDADNAVWGWYGLDWYFDASLKGADHDGFVRLRRMVKVNPANRAAYVNA